MKLFKTNSREFVKTVLVEKFNIHKIIIGYDHRFGRNRTANIDDLIDFGIKYGFEVEQISVQEIDAISVSSTKIHKALSEGDMTLANSYLGYDYYLTGTVFKGKQLGRTIGFPTANIKSEDYKLIPKKRGLHRQSIINNKVIHGIMNIGFNPTVEGESLSLEIHFLDFDNLYEKKISIILLKYLRPEQNLNR
jgi:riboflavin kinase/FMN adenylyltransferase